LLALERGDAEQVLDQQLAAGMRVCADRPSIRQAARNQYGRLLDRHAQHSSKPLFVVGSSGVNAAPGSALGQRRE